MPRIIGSIIDYRLAADDEAVATACIADPLTAIVSMTITEAGYAEPAEPATRTTFDLLAAGWSGAVPPAGRPLTMLSCDNLPGNGDVARGR